MEKGIWPILRRRFPEKEYALMAEVRDMAGLSASRSADYIAVNLYPSRGLAINGIELKSHRSDWLNELKNPEKGENIFQYCDYFWLLTTNDKIAKLEEIPKTWGWLCIQGGRIFNKKEAPRLRPKPLSKHFACAMLKKASDKTRFTHDDDLEGRLYQAEERGRNEKQRIVDNLTKELQEVNKAVKDFQTTSGIDLLHYYRWKTSPAKMGETVKFIEEGGTKSIREDLIGLEGTAKIILERISTALTLLPK